MAVDTDRKPTAGHIWSESVVWPLFSPVIVTNTIFKQIQENTHFTPRDSFLILRERQDILLKYVF